MKYALLIDSENAKPRLDDIFQELSKYGDTPIRYLVGNFTNGQVSQNWIKICQKHAITCIQTINFTKGKNSLDISLVIEGMRVLYEKSFIDGVIIVASDSDYTPLAREWRNAGKEVIGIGEKKTPESYRASCTKFIYVENIFNKKEEEVKEEETTEVVSIDKLTALIVSVLNENDGIAQLSVVVETIRKAYTDFDVRNYGFKKARDFFSKSFKDFKLTEEKENSFFISFKENKEEAKPEMKPLKQKKQKAGAEVKKEEPKVFELVKKEEPEELAPAGPMSREELSGLLDKFEPVKPQPVEEKKPKPVKAKKAKKQTPKPNNQQKKQSNKPNQPKVVKTIVEDNLELD